MSSHVFLELIVSMTNVYVNPHDFVLPTLAWLLLVRSTAVSITDNHYCNFMESCSLKMAISCSREVVRCVCFCAVHSVSMYWHLTSLNGSVGVGVEVGCMLSVRESVHSSCSKQSIQFNPPLVDLLWPLYIVVNCVFPLQVCRRLLRQTSASDPLKAIVVSELLVLSLSSVSGVFYVGIQDCLPLYIPFLHSEWS